MARLITIQGATIGWDNHQYAIALDEFRGFIDQIDEIEHGQWFEDDEAICCDIKDKRMVIRFSNRKFREEQTATFILNRFNAD